MKIKGKCKQCGKCCKNIQLDLKVDTESLLKINLNEIRDDLILRHIKNNPHLDFSKSVCLNVDMDKDSVVMRIYGIECRALKKRKGKYFCSIHKNKPSICERYPQPTSRLLKGCGYKEVEEDEKKQKKARKNK